MQQLTHMMLLGIMWVSYALSWKIVLCGFKFHFFGKKGEIVKLSPR